MIRDSLPIRPKNRSFTDIGVDYLCFVRWTYLWPEIFTDGEWGRGGGGGGIAFVPRTTSDGSGDESGEWVTGPWPFGYTPWVVIRFPDVVLEHVAPF